MGIDAGSGYYTEETDDLMMIEDSCPTVDVDDSGQPVEQNYDAAEAKGEYKAPCYEDIRIWIVQIVKPGERHLLAMEVSLRHYKGVDNKPKPYVCPPYPTGTHSIATFLFRDNSLPILCPISHM